MWLSPVHIPVKQNIAADRESHASRREIEWSLNKDIFNTITSTLVFFQILTSSLNYQIKPCVAIENDIEFHFF